MSFTLPLYRKAITASIAAAQSMPSRCRRTATMATARTVSTPNTVADDMFPIHMHPKSPSKLVNFTSHEGKRLFRGAMDQGHTESFFKLMGNFSTQSSPMLGGVSSLAMALNALEIDPKRRWKGNWRWYSDELLETCSSKEEVLLRGMSFDEFSCLAKSHCHVEARRARFTRYQQFLNDLEAITANNSRQVMVISYSRSRIGQMGQQGGHFSPIGGYNKEENMVLIMDVARGQYPSVWVDAELLFQSMQERELDMLGKSRGYFLLQAPQQHQASMMTTMMDRSPNKCSGCSRQCSKRFQMPTTTTAAAAATAAH